MRAGIQDCKVKLDAARAVRGLERVGAIGLGTHGGFPLLGGHEGVIEGGVGAEVVWGLVAGDGRAEVRRV